MRSFFMLWNYPPDWQTPLLETLQWKTDVILSFDGSEQRIALQQTPLQYLDFTFLIEGESQRRELEAKLWANGAKLWDVPIWTETVYTTRNIVAGSNLIPVDTVYHNFVVGNKVLLCACDGREELVEIAQVQSNSLILTQALGAAWEVESRVIPIHQGYLSTEQRITRFKGDTIYDAVRFEFEDHSFISPEVPSSLYRDYPVMSQVSDWQQDLTLQYQRKMQLLAFENGQYRDDETGQPSLLQSHYWTLDSREKIQLFKQFLYERRGRLAACWLPSFLKDLQLKNNIISGSKLFQIEHCGYVDLYQMKKNRRDIRIELDDGQVFYRRIVACEALDSAVEQLTLDVPIQSNISIDQVERISFMTFSRLASDHLELSWSSSDIVQVAANWMSINDDV